MVPPDRAHYKMTAMSNGVSISPFEDQSAEPPVRGFLHTPDKPNGHALVLAHSAGGDCQSKLLLGVASAIAEAGLLVLRADLPFRQQRPHGPPFPGSAARDREGLRRAVAVMGRKAAGKIFLGGHSYGGRQATMLAAEAPGLVAGLLLLSYPLHPPRKPDELRTAHFPRLTTPALFVHGTRDPFGSIEQMTSALSLVPARHRLFSVEGGGHDLTGKNASPNSWAEICEVFVEFSLR